MNLCYDLKRRPQNVRDVEGIISFDTVPWADIEEFFEWRDALDQWRPDKKRVLKTALDWRQFVTWNEARSGRRMAGVRGGRPRIVTLFMRAYARGELGLPGTDYAAAAALITAAGWMTTADNIKDAKRRGPLDLKFIDEFDAVELEFAALVSVCWPQSKLKDLLK